jgi:hypothetical protein
MYIWQSQRRYILTLLKFSCDKQALKCPFYLFSHIPVPSMDRQNETEPVKFSIFPFWAFSMDFVVFYCIACAVLGPHKVALYIHSKMIFLIPKWSFSTTLLLCVHVCGTNSSFLLSPGFPSCILYYLLSSNATCVFVFWRLIYERQAS